MSPLLWPIVIIMATLIIVLGALAGVGSIYAPPELVKTMLENRSGIRLAVLIVIVPTIAILCMQERITGEAAIASLASIASYLLGGVTG
jgi:hypothetical protein